MLRPYTNTSDVPQVVYDQWGYPQLAEMGQTIQVDSDESFIDIAALIMKTVTVGEVTYIGYARAGTLDTQGGWAIARVRIVGGIEEKLWAGGEFRFLYKWTERQAQSYG